MLVLLIRFPRQFYGFRWDQDSVGAVDPVLRSKRKPKREKKICMLSWFKELDISLERSRLLPYLKP
jgi:hypothetical protein